jgi:hypothetical protein
LVKLVACAIERGDNKRDECRYPQSAPRAVYRECEENGEDEILAKVGDIVEKARVRGKSLRRDGGGAKDESGPYQRPDASEYTQRVARFLAEPTR